ncbi:dihydroneopterin aldolase [Paenibacillus chartarius]|uniref:7,8-dihydroneopterin aldolase n=1 Tax=Paenibacillus chartarius TaxID=747481 RepID=A0ABV6DTW0_9BACL
MNEAAPQLDSIIMSGMLFYGYHGAFPEETRLGQRFMLDVTMRLPLEQAGRYDDLEQTINYADAYALIKGIVEGEPVKLLETLAERVAMELFHTYTRIHELTVRVTKLHPPFGGQLQGVSVEIHRKRA